MKRAMAVMAVLVLACGISSQARAEGHRDKDFAGTFEKTADGKLVFKSNNESHPVAAGDHARDDVKKKLADADKELVGQGTFFVIGNVKRDGDTTVLMVNNIIKKEGHGDRKEGGDNNVAGGGAAPVPAPGGDHKDGGSDRKDMSDDHK